MRKDKSVGDEWRAITYMVFDAPHLSSMFKKRLSEIKDELDPSSKHVKLLEHSICKGKKHLQEEMDKVLAIGGEGLMIKDPRCRYEQRRSEKLLKVKTFQDAEAKVLGWENGTGRCENMMGAIRVKDLKSGVLFKIGSGFTDQQRNHPPKKGTIVTYKYQNLTDAGHPRFPIFLREHPGI